MFAGVFGTDLRAQCGLPPVPVPGGNLITPQKTVLGKILFWDEQLSSNNRFACGSCHLPEFGGGDPVRMRNPGFDGIPNTADDTFGSPGMVRADANNEYLPDPVFGLAQQVTRRAAPSNLVAAWFPELLWDGRATDTFFDPVTGAISLPTGGSVESQAVRPVTAPAEMGHDARTWAEVVTKLRLVRPLALATDLTPDMTAALAVSPTYPQLFAAAFGGDPSITAERIAFAIATYQRTLVPDQSPWDQFCRGVPGAMNMKQMRGRTVFNGVARCNLCHPEGLFSDRQFRNIGLRPIAQDSGRAAITGNSAHRGQFKVPSLRNAGLRSSFMHTGEFRTMAEVVAFYDNGGGANLDNKDPLLQPLQLTPQETTDLIAFVGGALTDPRAAARRFPFDRPTLLSERLLPEGRVFGLGTPGSGGLVPRMLAEVPANQGNVDFKVGVGDALGGTFAALLVADKTNPPGTKIGGTYVIVDVTNPIVFPRVLSGAGLPGDGYVTIKLPLPHDPQLAGLLLFGQWFVFEPALPTIAASSRAAAWQFF